VPPSALLTSRGILTIKLFDGSNEGLTCADRPAFSVQYHPEASPGPSDSHYLFDRFVALIEAHKGGA
jgi:carbamoyl-phosphate synthase small subunit